VPAAATARINLLNAAAFLEEGRFVPAEEARAAGAKKPASGRVTITRTIGRGGPGGRPAVPYEITDRAPLAGSPDWRRVVAVFVGGAAWQFKGWPFPGAEAGDTVKLFASAAGFHVSLADEAAPAAVKEWNVTRLALHRTERHRDRSTVERVWRAVDDFLGPKGSKEPYCWLAY
jgi:parafibromin